MKGVVLGILTGLLTAGLILAVFVVSYWIMAGLSWLVCFCFGLPWDWFVPLGLLVLMVILRWVFWYVTK